MQRAPSYSCTLHIGRCAEQMVKQSRRPEDTIIAISQGEPTYYCQVCGAHAVWTLTLPDEPSPAREGPP